MWIVAALIVLPLALRLLVGLATHPIATLVGIVRLVTFTFGVGLSILAALHHEPGQLREELPMILLAATFLAIWITTFVPGHLIRARRHRPTYPRG